MNLFYLLLNAQGYPVEEARKKLADIHRLPPEAIGQYQSQAGRQIFEYHYRHNAAYRQWVNGHSGGQMPAEWGQIPILTKKDLQRPLEERLSGGIAPSQVHVHNTSGSSGQPFFFAKDKFCHALSWALIAHRFGQHGVVFGRSLQARFYGIPLGGPKYYKERLKDWVAARARFPVFDLSDRRCEQIMAEFAKQKFYYVNGYTSSLVLFAKYLISRGTSAKNICPSLQVVFTTSEVCDDIDRAVLEQGFGVKVVNEYGAAELDLIAVQDREGDWSVNYETLLVEVLDDAGQPTGPGQQGRVVVTSLYNKAMPFVRYELGDLAVLSGRSKGGYALLEKVVGRTNDIALLPSGKKSPGLTFYYISKALLEQGGIIKEFVIRQKAPDWFHFEYVASQELGEEGQRQVGKAMDTYLEPGLRATFERKAAIERTAAGKLKHFYCELEQPNK